MKLKHFLRGLGAGVIFATLVLTISFSLNGYKMSEEAIIEEALELGMVWPDRSSNKETGPTTTPGEQETSATEAPTTSQMKETTSESESTPEQTTTREPVTVEPTTPAPTTEAPTTEKPTTTEAPTTTELPATTEPPTTTETPTTTTEKETTTEAESTAPKPPQIIAGKSIITVPKGMNSIQVAKLLETAGAVKDAYDFDKYIERQGYSRRIQIGTHEIPLGSSYDEIIKIICGLK